MLLFGINGDGDMYARRDRAVDCQRQIRRPDSGAAESDILGR